ncbi:MAG TPA: iron-sulfur cluster biosynthesis family protein [Chloroflexota bacterium]|nr:iron-sulfur cluster biosynthesis family protein [Chloroflexota bacterium]
MIILSDEAQDYIRRLVEEENAEGGGLRISAAEDDGGDLTCELEITSGPEADDVVVEEGGARVFLDKLAADALDGAELAVADGDLVLNLEEAGGT